MDILNIGTFSSDVTAEIVFTCIVYHVIVCISHVKIVYNTLCNLTVHYGEQIKRILLKPVEFTSYSNKLLHNFMFTFYSITPHNLTFNLGVVGDRYHIERS